MNIGAAIKELRKEKDISQKELSSLTKISPTSLSLIETGAKQPSNRNLAKIAKALNTSISSIYLLAIEETDIPRSKQELFKVLFPSIKQLIIE